MTDRLAKPLGDSKRFGGSVPTRLARIARSGRFQPAYTVSLDSSLDAAAQWLARAQDATPDDGVAAYYNARRKRWAASYPETTGYIIPTLYHYARRSGREEFHERASRMAAWECEIQLPEGGVRAGNMDASPIVPTIFNTGQVLFGWAAAYEQTAQPRFAESLQRAADWLLRAMDDDGAWRRFSSPLVDYQVNTYNTRVAFGLARAAQVLGDRRYAEAAQANVDWALTQMRENGWLENNDLDDNDRPLTHTIAYAIRGILEVGVLVESQHFIERAGMAASAVARAQRPDGALPGRLLADWRPAARWSCLTGNCQMAIVWLRLAAIMGGGTDPGWQSYAERAVAYTQATQALAHVDPGCRGGIAGSQPRRGAYMRHLYPNWAANFFMAAIMLLDDQSPGS